MRKSPFKPHLILYISFLLASVGIFSQSFDNSFRKDDFAYLEAVRDAASPAELFRPTATFAFYRPAALTLFWLEYQLFGADHPGGYLIFNYVLHVIIGLLLLHFLLSAGFAERESWLAAGLFTLGACHYGKQVIWACTSGGLLAVLLGLVAMRLVNEKGEAPVWRRRLIASGLIAVALMLHEVAFVLAMLLVPLIWLLNPRAIRGSQVAFIAVPVAAWAVIIAGVSATYSAYGHAGEQLAHAPGTAYRLLGLMLFPVQPAQNPGIPQAVAAFLVNAAPLLQSLLASAVVILSLLAFRSGPARIRYVVVWLFAALIPYSLIGIPGGWLEIRYVYPAALPMCVLLSTVVFRLWGGATWQRALVSVGLLAFCLMTVVVSLRIERQAARIADSEPSRRWAQETPSSGLLVAPFPSAILNNPFPKCPSPAVQSA